MKFPYEKYFLENGLQVILHRDESIPLAAVNLWYRVGSANDPHGKSGLAHLFEHMMFQGSKHVQKGMHFKIIQEAGGTLNASTSFDRTNYFEKVPSNFLEHALWLESDRLGFLLAALDEEKLQNQKDVVANERLERYDNQPYGRAFETLLKNLFSPGHPYSTPTIGWMEDIKSYNLKEVKNFFTTHYSVSNASLVIAGSFDMLKTKNLIEKYFSEIIRNSEPETEYNYPRELAENKIIEMTDNVQLPRVYYAWQTEKCFSEYDAALDILSQIIACSKNSRLNKLLMIENQFVQEVGALHFSGKHDGMFVIMATLKPGQTIDFIEAQIFSEIEKLIKNCIDENEIARITNSIKASFIYSIQNLDVVADQLNHYNFYLDEPDYFSKDIERYNSVSKDDLLNVAKKYFTKPYLKLIINPK